jgi:hypothetical protein
MMGIDLSLTLWQFLMGIVAITSAFGANTYLTKQNSKDLEGLKSNEKEIYNKMEALQLKCDLMMTETVARNTFVDKEVFLSEIKHLNHTLTTIENQNLEILKFFK